MLTKLTDGGLVARSAEMGARLQVALEQRFGDHPHIGDIRGRGLFRGLEIVQDRGSKAPFDPGRAVHKHLKTACFDAGLICYPMGGTIDGERGDHILLAPPFILEDQHIDEITSKLAMALEQVL